MDNVKEVISSISTAERANRSFEVASLIEKAVVYATGPVAGVIAGSIALLVFKASLELTALLSILFAYIAQQTAYYVDDFREQRRRATGRRDLLQFGQSIRSSYGDIQTFLKNSFQVDRLSGDTPSIVAEVSSHLARASSIKNTCLHMMQVSGATTFSGETITRTYETFLADQHSSEWHDLVGMDDFDDGRFDRIFPNGNGDVGTKHKISVLNTHSAIINFVLVGQPDRFTDVYFGWIRNQSAGIIVFHSSDQRLIELFDGYFDILQSSPDNHYITVDYTQPSKIRFVRDAIRRISGRWLTVSGVIPVRKSKKIRQLNEIFDEIVDYTILDFTFTNPYLEITGAIFDRHGRQTGSISSENVVVSGSRVYVRYNILDATAKNSGIAVYSFSETFDIDEMNGFYVEDRQPNRREFRGIRIRDDSIPTIELANAHIERLIERLLTKARERDNKKERASADQSPHNAS